MEKRLYFIIGDLFANALIATIAVALTTWLIGGSWGMIPGMLVGMLLGMVITLPLSLVLLTPILGVMEILSPCMISGMLGGNFFPLDMMPPSLQFAGMWTFNYWANRAFADIITRGQGLLSVVDEIVVLASIATVGLLLATAIFALRQRRGVAA